MTVKVIDTTTGKEPTDRVINNIAKNGGLMICDIDGFYVGEDGQIILVDDCGNATWVDMDRFKAVPDVLNKIRAEIDRQEKWLSQAGYTPYNVDIAFDSIKTVLKGANE